MLAANHPSLGQRALDLEREILLRRVSIHQPALSGGRSITLAPVIATESLGRFGMVLVALGGRPPGGLPHLLCGRGPGAGRRMNRAPSTAPGTEPGGERWIDTLGKVMAASPDRRVLLRGVVAILGGLTAGRRGEVAAAACKKVGRGCARNSDCCDHATCKQDECACKNGFDDCDGACVKLATDEKHCGRCDRRCAGGETCRDAACAGPCGGRTCAETEECVGGVCTTPPGGCPPGADSCASNDDVSCGGRAGCDCLQSTEGVTLCGDGPIPGVFCGSCASSADCAEFGEGAFCGRSTNTDVCCGPDAQNACRRPCPA